MPAITWDAPTQHFYETGVSNGVLYVMDDNGEYGEGVAWNGLSSVTESPEGAEPTAIYADNIKYLSLLSAEEFKGTIEAYTYPPEFMVCDGSAELVSDKGVYIGQQVRKQFAFSYQSKVGNEVNADLGYKIHIIYGCFASPSEVAHETINDSPEASTMSWEITSTPVAVTGFKPTSHVVIDSRKVPAAKLTAIKEALYGGEGAEKKSGVLLPDAIATILNAQ